MASSGLPRTLKASRESDTFHEAVLARLQSALGKPSHALHISLWQLLPLGWRLSPVVCHALLLHYTPFTADDVAMSRTFATGWVGVLCLITFCMHPDLCTHAELDDSLDCTRSRMAKGAA